MSAGDEKRLGILNGGGDERIVGRGAIGNDERGNGIFVGTESSRNKLPRYLRHQRRLNSVHPSPDFDIM
jgi:hypothetical protein